MNEVMQWYERDMTLAQAMDGIETNMWASVRNYIAVGFYLKAIRDRKLFQEAGYQNFEEFVRDKYDRDKGWASRCIKVNDQLSKDGNSPALAEEYREYKVSQLVELAYLTEEQRTLANPDMTVKQLQAIRKPEPQQEKEVVTLQPELKEHEGEMKGKVVTSQLDEGAEREPEVIHFTAGNRTIDNAYGATIAAVVRAYLDAGYSRPEKECEVTAFGLVYKVLKRQDVTVFYPDSGRTVFDIENVRLEEEYQYRHGTKAEPELVTSQVESEPGPQDEEPEPEPELPKTEQTQLEKSGKCIHRPEFDCTLEEAHKLIPGTGEDCSRVCCWECVRRGDCELECYSSQRRPAPQLSAYGTPRREYPADSLIATEGCEGGHDCFSCSMECEIRQAERRCVGASCGNPFPCEILMNLDGIREQIGENCEFVNYELAYHRAGDGEPSPCCKHCKNPCEYICEWAMRVLDQEPQQPAAKEQQNEEICCENENQEETAEAENEPSDVDLLRGMLEKEKEFLDEMIKVDKVEPLSPKLLRKKKILVAALAGMLCNLEEPEPEEPKQPALPVLKNNDQRAAFVDAYETWPLWIETEQTGERYYRYDLEDGTSMVVKVYHARIFDGYASGSYEAKYHDGYGRHKYYMLRDGKLFRDCETNRGLLIEKLKEIQKVKKG